MELVIHITKHDRQSWLLRLGRSDTYMNPSIHLRDCRCTFHTSHIKRYKKCTDANSIPTRPGVYTCQQALLPPSCNQPPLQHTRTQTAQDHMKNHIENDFTQRTTSTYRYKQLYKQSAIFQVLSDDTVTKPGLTLSSYKDCSHFADMTPPPPCSAFRNLHYFCFVATGASVFHKHMSSFYFDKGIHDAYFPLVNYSMNQLHTCMLPYG